MTQEEKELLLKDLCARLPYGVKIFVSGGEFDNYQYPYYLTAISKFRQESLCKVYNPIFTPLFNCPDIESVKPYLRPMSSMTEEEKREYNLTKTLSIVDYPTLKSFDWLNAHHFDYRGLIERGLAIEVTDKNNPYKE